jgi:23S rRNA pseudouridine1911/1915/1917 synthase
MIKGVYEVDQKSVRLDAFLINEFKSTTRAFVREAVSRGDVLLNGRRTLKGVKLKCGDVIEIKELLESSDNRVRPSEKIPVRLVFEDDNVLAFNKHPGISVQPLSCRETDTLMNGVVARYPECASVGDSPLMAGALHRIDAGTSGLVLVARNQDAFANLRGQFAAQNVEKTYLALVEGFVAVGGTLENDLVHDPSLPYCKMIDVSRLRSNDDKIKSFHAVTKFRPIGHTTFVNEERTLLEVTIFTGVTHQIRAQLAHAVMYIVNDRLYGAFAVEDMVGHCLHALSARFRHPVNGDEMKIVTDYPAWARL